MQSEVSGAASRESSSRSRNGYDVRQATLACLHLDSRLFRQRLRQWARNYWFCVLLFLVAWLTSGVCLFTGQMGGGELSTALWKNHHTVRAEYPFQYRVPGNLPVVVARYDEVAAQRNRQQLEQCRSKLFTSNQENNSATALLCEHFSRPGNWNFFLKYFEKFQSSGIMPDKLPRQLHNDAPKFRLLVNYDENGGRQRLYSCQNLPVLPEEAPFFCAAGYTASLSGITMPEQQRLTAALTEMLNGNIVANLSYDTNLSEVWQQGQWQELEIKTLAGEELLAPSPETVARYDSYTAKAASRSFDRALLKQIIATPGFLLPFLGCGILIGAMMLTINFMRLPRAGQNRRSLLVILSLVLDFVMMALATHRYTASSIPITVLLSALPLALFPAILTNLLGWRPAACFAVFNSLMLPILLHIPPFHYKLFYFALFISLTAIPLFNNLSRRVQYLTRGLLTGIIIAIAEMLFLIDRPLADILPHLYYLRGNLNYIAAPLLNGLGTGIVCIISLPLLEMLFQLATPIALHELSDLNSPLLKRLRAEAPGTYEHSLAVADLATNAAIAIGIDARLAYAMSLYHDIGKLYAPKYFAENSSSGQNPHDRLPPQESAAIIREHVNFGVELARKHHLSPLLMPAITQHHGNSLIAFFYNKAREEAEKTGAAAPSEDDFRYPHPPPAARETALVSLADACEAAVRAMLSQKPDTRKLSEKLVEAITPLMNKENGQLELGDTCTRVLANDLETSKTSKIKEIDQRISAIINGKIAEHQLDNTDLTARDLGVIRHSFLETIMNKSHARPEYLR